ncbi:MAG: DUF6712 family protein [Bacteroidales bacterium]
MLFNKDDIGNQEIKDILGFINADLSFDNLKTDIELAEEEMRALLGDDLFDAIVEFYNSDDFERSEPSGEEWEEGEQERITLWTKIVKYSQAPVAFYAYREFADSGDLMHSNKGRTMISNENEKTPFEWMIERNNQSMIAKAHKLTDRLLSLIDANPQDEDLAEVYFETEAFSKNHNNLILNARVFNEIYPIDNSPRFFAKVAPFIREIEDTRVIPVLTSETYDFLLAKLLGSDPLDDDDKILIRFARVPIVLYTMATAIERFSIEVLPSGVFQNYIPGAQSMMAKNPAPSDIKSKFAALLTQQADFALSQLQKHLAKVAAEDAGETYDAGLPTDRHSSDNQYFRA